MGNDMIIRNGINYSHDDAESISFDNTQGSISLSSSNVQDVIYELFDKMYPVGTIYMSVSNTNPSTLFGGTWEAWGSGKVPVGVDSNDTDFDTVEETGGTKSVTLTSAQSGVPAHAHGLNSHTHSVGAHSHGLNSHKHSVGAHSHGLNSHTHSLNNHTHSVGAHSHGLNDHTHSIPQLTVSSWTGSHQHTLDMYAYNDPSGGWPQGQSKAPTTATAYKTSSVSITVSGQKTTASTTGKSSGSTANSTAFNTGGNSGNTGAASGSTANSTAFDTGAASGNTANSTAFDTGAATGNTANNTAADASSAHTNLQPYITCYMWKRTA